MTERVIIVGAGQAGARTALALRQEGWQGGLLLIGAEPEFPYERPPLSKDVLQQRAAPADATILSEAQCASSGIELWRSQQVRGIDLERKQLSLDSASAALRYDHLVLATGSRPRNLPIPGAGLAGVYLLRIADDALQIAARLGAGANVVLIGGGFIGLEAAASATLRGCRVTVLETAPQLMSRIIGTTLSEVFAAMHRARGVDVRTGVRIECLEGVETVKRVRLADGSTIDADVVIVGIGALANDGLPVSAGMACADGVVVDHRGQSSCPHTYAVGDLARHQDLWGARNVRLESWENAELQAKAVARAIVGKDVVARGAPWFWTDQFDTNFQMLGYPRAGDEIVMRGTPDDRSWCAFMLSKGRLSGACLNNAGRERRVVSQLMEQGIPVSREELSDPHRPLRSLLAATAS